MLLQLIFLFIHTSGLIIGLGAVTVIDLLGLFSQKSSYWTVATIRAHKITKPLIWLGIILHLVGGLLYYPGKVAIDMSLIQLALITVLIINGCFLSFSVSPYLLKKEAEGKDSDLLPESWQSKIRISFMFSFACWWSLVMIFCYRMFASI